MEMRNILCFLFLHVVFGQVLSEEICKSLMNSNCVTINLCEPFANLMKFFETTAETREMLRKISCGFEGATPKVCCPNSHFIPKEANQRSIFDPTDVTLDPVSFKGKEAAVTFAPVTIQDKGYEPRYGGLALDMIWNKAEPTTFPSPIKFGKQMNETSTTTINGDSDSAVQKKIKHATTPLSQSKVGQAEPGYRDIALENIWNKVLEPTIILETDESWNAMNKHTPIALNSDSMQGEIKPTTTPVSFSKVGQIEDYYGNINLDTIWDKVVEPTTSLSPITFLEPKNQPSAPTINSDSMQKEMKYSTTLLTQNNVSQAEPAYKDLALENIWNKVEEPAIILEHNKSWNPKNESKPTALNNNSMQGEIEHATTPVSFSKVAQIEPGYRGLALNTIWDKFVEPTTLLSTIKFGKAVNEPTATTLYSDMQGDIKHSTTPLSSSKVAQIEPGYRSIALDTIWDIVLEPTTLLSSIKFLNPINELTPSTLKSKSAPKELEHATTPLHSDKVGQVEPGYKGITFNTIFHKVVEPSTLLSAINFWEPTTESTTNISIYGTAIGNDDANLNSSRIWQIEPASPTLAPARLLDEIQKPLTAIPKSDVDLEKPIKTSPDFITAFPSPPECGVSKSSFGGRVVDGVDAYLGDLPWMTLLGYRDRVSVTSWNCGGSLISRHHVLTAAHCIHNYERALYVVRLGELDLAREDEGAIPIDVLIKDKVKHEQYNPTSYENDIGLLILQKDVQFTDLIKPICMPLISELRSADLESWRPFIAGWGQTKARGSKATHLQVLQLPVVSNDICKNTYKRYENQLIDDRVVCAGFMKGGKDSCGGDSGGPLMQPFPQNLTSYFYQIGVISYGARDCAMPGYPGVYTRITSFMTWLETNVLGVS